MRAVIYVQNAKFWGDFLVFNATLSNISAISWRPALVVEEAGVSRENHRPWPKFPLFKYFHEFAFFSNYL
jgi:hypothetical protein